MKEEHRRDERETDGVPGDVATGAREPGLRDKPFSLAGNTFQRPARAVDYRSAAPSGAMGA